MPGSTAPREGEPLNASGSSGWRPPPSDDGYWEVASDGGVFAFGAARFYGSERGGGQPLNAPMVGIAPPRPGRSRGIGWWRPTGGSSAFGDATFWGSTAVLGSTGRSSGWRAPLVVRGYWLVGSNGGVFGFGDAAFWGSTGSLQLDKPIVGLAPTAGGYWEAASDGGIFSLGSAPFDGSVPRSRSRTGADRPLRRFPAPSQGRTLRSSQATRGLRCESAHSPAQPPATSSRRWLPTRRTGGPPGRCWRFRGTPSPPAWRATSSARRNTSRNTKPTPRRRSRSSRSIGTKVILVGLPLARVRQSQSERLRPRSDLPIAGQQQHRCHIRRCRPSPSWRTDGLRLRLFHASPASPARGQPGQTSSHAPDGVHFCPDGKTTLVGGLEECDVYSSGRVRFAAACSAPALTPPSLP